MNVTLRIALQPGSGDEQRVFDVNVPAGTAFGVLRRHLHDALDLPALASDGIEITDQTCFGRVPLLDGALLERRRDGVDNAMSSPLRLVVAVGPSQGRACPLTPGEHVLGRSHPLLAGDTLVSRRHALVTMTRGGVEVNDTGSSNGTSLDGSPLVPGESSVWKVGGHLRLGGSVIRLDTVPDASAHAEDGRGRLVPDMAPLYDEQTAGQQVEWPRPSPLPSRSPMRWVAALAPVPVAIILAFVMKSPLMLAFMVLGPLTIGLTHIDDRRRGKTSRRAAERRFLTERTEAARRVARLLQVERMARSRWLQAPDVVTDIAAGRRPGLASNTYGWPLEIRMGHGSSPSVHTVLKEGHEHVLTLDDAPVSLKIERGGLLHIDPSEDQIDNCLELVVARLMTQGTPNATELLVVSPSTLGPRWVWCRDTSRLRVRSDVPDDVVNELIERATRPGHFADDLPVVVLDYRSDGAHDLLRRWGTPTSGALIWVGGASPALRVETTVGVNRHRHERVRVSSAGAASLTISGHAFTLDRPLPSWFPTTTRLLRRWVTDVEGSPCTEIPTRVTSHDVLPVDTSAAWRAGPRSDIPIGRGVTHTFHLDLVRAGPHALVAGTTGAGKSEFLLAYLRGLFCLNSPADVIALLIDYKGGATFGPLMRAPHVVGVVTDLDDGLAARALIALQAEIKRRERYLADRGHSSYTSYRDRTDDRDPLPRLFVVVDEFRVLAEELPDFVSGLVRLASVGRSLGMHLVLATQRPGGAVTADMRANLDVRVALRVRERSDSLDVIDSPAAAKISARHPGRAFVAHSGMPPVEIQTVFTGTPRESAADLQRVHFHEVTGESDASVPHRCPGCRPGSGLVETTDLQQFVVEAQEAAQGLPVPRRPLLPPLGQIVAASEHARDGLVRWSDLLLARPAASSDHDVSTGLVAVADLPHDQSQPAVTDIGSEHIGFAGAPRSGRTVAASVVAAARRARGDQLWWVGDGPDGPVDEWFDAEDPHEVVRFLSALGEAPPAPAVATTIVVDGWEPLHDSLLRINHGLGADEMLRHVQRGHQMERLFVITGGRLVLASKLAALLEVKVVLRQNDQTEYSLAGLRPAQVPSAMPPGRGIVLPHAHVVQFASPSSATSAM